MQNKIISHEHIFISQLKASVITETFIHIQM